MEFNKPTDIVESVTLVYADGNKEVCRYVSEQGNTQVFECKDGEVSLTFSDHVLGLSVTARKPLNPFFFVEIDLKIKQNNNVLSLTINPSVADFYAQAFSYYNPLAVDREPSVPRPPDNPVYPSKTDELSHIDFVKRFPCWAYPVIGTISPYTIFVLLKVGESYISMLSLSSGDTVAYLWPGLKLRVFLGSAKNTVDASWLLSIGIDVDPYEAVRKCVYTASKFCVFKPRDAKRRPPFIDKLGWCSWNALLTEDLSHYNVVSIVKGLLDRGVPIRWVLIDDGWQNEVRKGKEWFVRVLKRLGADEKKFPMDLRGVVEDLKKLGEIELTGLWHTINIHWGGFDKEFIEKMEIQGYRNPFADAYVPIPETANAMDLYEKFLRWVKSQGFDLVKVDNQWIIHALYWGRYSIGKAAKAIQVALQLATAINGLDIINCMSMVPEDYSNYFLSNVMRVSMDYIPFWKADAKLHTMFSIYNALLFSHIAYPDYDMWITYDPYAKVHAVARVFSGGPVYITDRHPEKTDINIVNMITLDNGEVVRVDEPGLLTRDILFRDPYNEKVLLKIAGRVGESIALALFNINRDGVEIEENIGLEITPYRIDHDSYIYYSVFSREKGVVRRGEKVSVKLGELDVEVMIFTPIKDGRAVIGLKEYILPPYPIKTLWTKDRLYIVSKASGTLMFYSNGVFTERYIEKNSVIEIP